MTVTFPYSPGPFNVGMLSDELIAGDINLVIIRGDTTSIDVVCADGTVEAEVDTIVAAHDPTPPAEPEPGEAFPVGSIYIATTDDDPALTLGYGTWEAFGAGRVMVGYDVGDADFDAGEKTGGAKTVTSTGAVSQPTFTGDALGTHTHGVGTYAPSSHAGTAVGDHPAHTHSVTSNVTVSDHAAHTHTVTSNVAVGNHANHTHTFTASATAATPDLVTSNAAGSGVAPSGTTGNESATLTHSVTNNQVTSGNPSATLSHSVTNNAVTSGNPSATLSHSVTQPSDHTMGGSSQAVSGGTPAGTVSTPTYTGNATSVVQPYITVYAFKRTA